MVSAALGTSLFAGQMNISSTQETELITIALYRVPMLPAADKTHVKATEIYIRQSIRLASRTRKLTRGHRTYRYARDEKRVSLFVRVKISGVLGCIIFITRALVVALNNFSPSRRMERF